jgi:nodulation protein Z
VSDSPRYLVVKGKAGMGNRMLALLSSMLYARASGRRLIVDWSDFAYSSDRSNVFHRLFACPEAEPPCPIPDTDSVTPAIWRGHLDLTANLMIRKFAPGHHSGLTIHRKFSADLSRVDHPEEVAVVWSFTHQFKAVRRHVHGPLTEFAGLSDMEVARQMLGNSLRPLPSVMARVDEFDRRYLVGQGPVVGLHIRYTDRKTPLPALRRSLNRIRSVHPDCPIFLATDNLSLLHQFTRLYAPVISTPKWYPESGKRMHASNACEDKLEAGIEALVDMYLLARCDYLVYSSNSTFPVISSLVTKAPPSNVIDVERRNLVVRARQTLRARFA